MKIRHLFSILIVFSVILNATIMAQTPQTARELGFSTGFPPSRTIDISQWDKGDDCRWAFQHISEIIPTANISRGSGNPSTLPRQIQDISGLRFTTHESKEMSVNEMIETTYTDGMIVLHNGNIVMEKYYNGMQPDTRHLLMSVSKSLTGILAGELVSDGRLNPEALVVDYIPELKQSSGYSETTVREVLDMTTAIVFSEDYANPNAEVIFHEQATGWRGDNDIAKKGVYAYSQTIKKADYEHGLKFHYASINTDVLGWLIQRTSGQRFKDFMSASIWSKLGAEHDAQISVDYLGSPVANGGFCITLRDLARFSQMVLDDGYYNGEQIISSGWIDDIKHNGVNAAWKPTKYVKIWPNGSYRNQWYNTGDDHGSFFAVGVNGQFIWINPKTRTVIVKFSSHPVSADMDIGLLNWYAFDAIARAFD